MALRMGQFAEAERLASDVLKASRTDAAAAAMLAQALIAQNRGSEAVAPLEKVVRRGNDAGLETLLRSHVEREERFLFPLLDEGSVAPA